MEQTRREVAAKSRDDATALDATAAPFDLPVVELREDPTCANDTVTVLSLYGGTLTSLAQIKHIDCFVNLTSLCVHGCKLSRMDVDPALRACRSTLIELNLSSNRIARVEGFPVMLELRLLDLTNNALVTLAGIDEGAPLLTSLQVARNSIKTLHALGVPRHDAKDWALEHLDLRANHLNSFADVAAGLGAVTSLKTLRLMDVGEQSEQSERAANPVTAHKAYRQAIASIAPWIDELDSAPLSRLGVDLAEGSAVLDEEGAFEKSAAEQLAEEKSASEQLAEEEADEKMDRERRAREVMERDERLDEQSDERRTRRTKRTKEKAKQKAPVRPRDDDTDTYSESESLVASGKGKEGKTPKIDQALARWKTRERAKEKAKSEPAEDPAVLDHEMRLRRIERNLVTAAAAANRVSVESVESLPDLGNTDGGDLRLRKAQVEFAERAKRAASASPTGREEEQKEKLTDRDEAAGGKKNAKTRRIDKTVPPPGPAKKVTKGAGGDDEDDNKNSKPAWQKPDLRPERVTPPTTPGRKISEESSDWAAIADEDDVGARGGGKIELVDSSTSTNSVSALEMALEESRLAAAAAAAQHETEKQSLTDGHAAFVAAMNVALFEANQVRDAILLVASEFGLATGELEGNTPSTSVDHNVSPGDLAALFRSALTEREGNTDADAAATTAAAELVETRADSAAAFASMRAQHIHELEANETALAAAIVARDSAVEDATTATTKGQAAFDKLTAVEHEFRAALTEAAEHKERLIAEVDEFTDVAREALRGKAEAERLAEELAEVCEQQRTALEELSRDWRRADRAEADCAAARADCGDMTSRLRSAEKRAAASKAAETAALAAFDAVKDEKATAHAALVEIGGVREQLSLARDNCRVKDAMLESQAELVQSLKGEAARAREAGSGAVKAAAESERAAEFRARRAEDETRREAGAVERVERALEEARCEKDSLELELHELRAAVKERDATLGYVGAEVESVKALFSTKTHDLRRERDELLVLVNERDEYEASVRNETTREKDEAARVKREATDALTSAIAKQEAADRCEHEARETVRRVESEMRALLAEVAQQRRKTRELGSALQSMYA